MGRRPRSGFAWRRQLDDLKSLVGAHVLGPFLQLPRLQARISLRSARDEVTRKAEGCLAGRRRLRSVALQQAQLLAQGRLEHISHVVEVGIHTVAPPEGAPEWRRGQLPITGVSRSASCSAASQR